MISAVVLCLLLQDPLIDECVKALSHSQESVRRDAEERLRRTPFEKLTDLEPHLKNPDAGIRRVIESVMQGVIASQFGTRKNRFELRPVAPVDVMKAWIKEKADPSKPPKDCEAFRVDWKDIGTGYEVYERDWILLQAGVISEKDVAAALPEIVLEAPDRWTVRFELSEKGSREFDEVAGKLYAMEPRGKLAIVVDGRILMAPVVHAPRFQGRGVIQGDFKGAEARKVAQILTGDWITSTVRFEATRKDAEPVERMMDVIRHFKGLSEATVQRHDAQFEISGLVNLKEARLVELWQTLRDRGYRLIPRK